MNTLRSVLIKSLFIIIALFGVKQITMAANPYINVPEQQRLSREAWQHYWNSLSPRQQHLSKSIDSIENNYYSKNGRYITITRQTLNQVMNAIGATPSEADFVLSRMRAFIEADKAVENADRLIEGIMNNPLIWR